MRDDPIAFYYHPNGSCVTYSSPYRPHFLMKVMLELGENCLKSVDSSWVNPKIWILVLSNAMTLDIKKN